MAVQKARVLSNVFTLATNQAVVGDTDTLWFQVPQGIKKVCVQVVASSTAGNVSGEYQAYVSNDGIHWVEFDSPIYVENIPNGGSVIEIQLDHNFAYMKYNLKSISGTNAKLTLTVAL